MKRNRIPLPAVILIVAGATAMLFIAWTLSGVAAEPDASPGVATMTAPAPDGYPAPYPGPYPAPYPGPAAYPPPVYLPVQVHEEAYPAP